MSITKSDGSELTISHIYIYLDVEESRKIMRKKL